MARPALSASRGMEIIDFLAAFPGRAFTLSEIARAAKVNVASCHAILNALVARGYLTRDQKAYRLGHALVALGQAALQGAPLVARAQDAAQALAQELRVPVLLTGVAGDEILAIAAFADPTGRLPEMRVGQRLPLVPPVGSPFLAWASDAAQEAWIARMAPRAAPAVAEQWRRDLKLIRKRGFHVTVRQPGSAEFGTRMADMATGRKAPEYREQLIELVQSVDERSFHPSTIDRNKTYDVGLISAPIFDQNGEAAFALCLVNLPGKVSGATINAFTEKVTQASLRVMRHARVA